MLVDFDGSGRHSVCLFINEVTIDGRSTTFQVPATVILDGTGKVRRRVGLKGKSGKNFASFYQGFTWWRKFGLGGNGKEALLFYDVDGLQAVGGEQLESLWRFPLPDDAAKVLEVLPAGKTIPSTIAVWSGKSVYGISKRETAKQEWRGEMPTPPPVQQIGPAERVLLQDRNGAGLPRLLSSDGCRLTWPVDADGRYQPPSGKPRDYDVVPDPVSLRRFPGHSRPMTLPILLQIIVWTLLWIIVPFALLRLAMKRRSWRLAFLPALFQIANVWVLKIIPADWNLSIGPSLTQKLDPHVGIALVSGVLLLVHFIWASRRRLWAIVDAERSVCRGDRDGLVATWLGGHRESAAREHKQHVLAVGNRCADDRRRGAARHLDMARAMGPIGILSGGCDCHLGGSRPCCCSIRIETSCKPMSNTRWMAGISSSRQGSFGRRY